MAEIDVTTVHALTSLQGGNNLRARTAVAPGNGSQQLLYDGYFYGTVKKGTTPVAGAKVCLHHPDSGIILDAVLSDVNGKFVFKDKETNISLYHIFAYDPDTGAPLNVARRSGLTPTTQRNGHILLPSLRTLSYVQPSFSEAEIFALLAHWENYNDSSGNGHTMSFPGGTPNIVGTAAKPGFGNCGDWNPPNRAIIAHANQFTFPKTFVVDCQAIFNAGMTVDVFGSALTDANTGAWRVRINDTAHTMEFFHNIGGGLVSLCSGTIATWGGYRHFCVSRSNGVIYLYMDGAVIASAASNHTYGDSSGICFGGNPGGTNSGNGRMDEFRVLKGYSDTNGASGFTAPTAPYANP